MAKNRPQYSRDSQYGKQMLANMAARIYGGCVAGMPVMSADKTTQYLDEVFQHSIHAAKKFADEFGVFEEPKKQEIVNRTSPVDTFEDTQHPIQPVVDVNGVHRFKENAIVRFLLDNGGYDMNKLALLPFSQEDREQFAQLIGYSVCGACDLDYVSDRVAETGLARSEHLARKEGKVVDGDEAV